MAATPVLIVVTSRSTCDALASALWLEPVPQQRSLVGGCAVHAFRRLNEADARIRVALLSAVEMQRSSCSLVVLMGAFPEAQCFVFTATPVCLGSAVSSERLRVNCSTAEFVEAAQLQNVDEEMRGELRRVLERNRVYVPEISVMAESMRTYEAHRDRAYKRRTPLPRDWSSVLAEHAEPIAEGQPVCGICLSNRATICFVDCGDQAACDDCVREWAERDHLQHRCPFCRAEVTQIVRPRLGRVEEESPTKRARAAGK